ncbi:hypothetical protein M987_04551 [Enterobacter soli ATCC BAA-2102]|nr:hypothetical protein M987_04551 [Enterobacter soli ATCC BAA-2102]
MCVIRFVNSAKVRFIQQCRLALQDWQTFSVDTPITYFLIN